MSHIAKLSLSLPRNPLAHICINKVRTFTNLLEFVELIHALGARAGGSNSPTRSSFIYNCLFVPISFCGNSLAHISAKFGFPYKTPNCKLVTLPVRVPKKAAEDNDHPLLLNYSHPGSNAMHLSSTSSPGIDSSLIPIAVCAGSSPVT